MLQSKRSQGVRHGLVIEQEEHILSPLPSVFMPHALSLSRSRLFATLWTIALQVPLSVGFSRQEYWSELPFPPPGDLPDPGIEPPSPASPALAGRFFITEPPGKSPLPRHVHKMLTYDE